MKFATLVAMFLIGLVNPPVRGQGVLRGGNAVDVTITKQHKMLVETRVNGVKGNFLVDTGAGNSYLSDRFANVLRMERNEGGYSYNVMGEMRFDIADVNSLELGLNRVPVRHRLIHVSNLDWTARGAGSGSRINGIIGADILIANQAVIDCTQGRIWFGNPGSHTSFPKRAAGLVSRQGDEIAIIARVNGVAGIFIVDTGYNVSILSPEFAQRMSVTGGGRSGSRVINITSLEIGVNRLPARLLRMTVSARLSIANQGYMEQGEAPYDGVLGMDFLAGNHAVIDCRQRALRFD